MDAQAAAGDLAAQWLDESLRDGQVLGLSWGTSLQAMVDSFSVDQPRSVEVVPLVGGLSTVVSLVSGEELVRELAGKLGATYRYLHAPGLLRSKTARDSLLAEPTVADVLERAQTADIAMVGIGAAGTGSSSEIIDGLGLSRCGAQALSSPEGRLATPAAASSTRKAGRSRGRARPRARDRARSAAPHPDGDRGGHGNREGAGRARRVRGELVDGLIIDASLALALLSEPRKN